MGSSGASSGSCRSAQGHDRRMVCGPVISKYIFLNVSDMHVGQEDIRARLIASPRQEIWLESSGAQLQDLSGRLHIVIPDDGPLERHARICRDGDGYCVEVSLPRADRAGIVRLGADCRSTTSLKLVFDVEYAESYESPGGYSAVYGVRYWDDVHYPIVDADHVEFG